MSRRTDPITPELAAAVVARDGPCVAPLVDPECGPCSGRTTFEHVLTELRMGRRAKSDLGHVVAACEGHTEPGMKAGHVWNLSHKNELRAYLRDVAA